LNKLKKQEIEREINAINSFGVGMGIMVVLLGFYLYVGLKPGEIVYPFVATMIAILVRTAILKRRVK
jgi:hypothetical protein